MKQAVFTSFDEGYADYALVMLKTFCENYHGDMIDFYCLTPESLHHLEQQYVSKCGSPKNVNIKFVTAVGQSEIDSILTDDDIKISYITKQCFHRLFIADAFPDIEIAIYIDPDTIVLRDIQALIDYPLPSAIAARSETSDENKESVVGPDRVYFNNGVYKTNLKFWRENDIINKMMSHVRTNGISLYPEQDLMNRFLSSQVSELHINFNYSSWFDHIGYFRHTVPSPAIVHFSGPDKPWKDHNLEQTWTNIWRQKYLDIFGEDITKSDGFKNLYEYDRDGD